MQNGKYEGKGVCINGKEGGGILELCRTEIDEGEGGCINGKEVRRILELCRTEKMRGRGGACIHRKRGRRDRNYVGRKRYVSKLEQNQLFREGIRDNASSDQYNVKPFSRYSKKKNCTKPWYGD